MFQGKTDITLISNYKLILHLWWRTGEPFAPSFYVVATAGSLASMHFLKHIDEWTLEEITLFSQRMMSSCPTMASWRDGLCYALSPHTD